jgi:hypothetical protein
VAIGDLYAVKDYQLYAANVNCLNVYYYKQTAGVGGAEELVNAFLPVITDYICYIQSEIVGHTRLGAYNTDSELDWFETIPVGAAGQRGGDALPPFVCYAFRLNRASTGSRHGQKRYVGVCEPDQVNGITTGTIQTALGALASKLEDTNQDLDGNAWELQIVRKIPPVPPSTTWLYAEFPIASVQFVSISSQNSRKYGRGA